jgi:hypothetical protein
MLNDYKVSVPEGQSGEWRVERYIVTPEAEEFERLRALINYHRPSRFVPAGAYTKLTRRNTIVMSDTPDEIRDHLGFIQRAHGRLLIAGLGLGVVLKAVLQKPTVESVTVVEQSQDVINLVWPSAIERRATLVHDDIFTWKPPKGARYDFAWFDIWDGICGDNLPEMTKLHRRFGRRVRNCDSWCHAICRRHYHGSRASLRRSFAAVGGDPMRKLEGDFDE